MPANRRSLALTDAYRTRLLALGDRVEREAKRRWPTIQELDGTDWPERMASELSRAQRDGVRLTAGYLGAFIRSEGGRGTTPAIDSRKYAGLSRDGRPLAEALASPIIGVRTVLKQGRPAREALALGLTRAVRTTGFEAVQTSRDALVDTIETDGRFTGFQRAVAGTCAACMALSGALGPRFEVHPGCECVAQPIVTGTTNRFPLPTGAALFAAKSKPEQDAAIGAPAADRIRDGEAHLEDFVSHSKQAEQPDFITQRPVSDVAGA